MKQKSKSHDGAGVPLQQVSPSCELICLIQGKAAVAIRSTGEQSRGQKYLITHHEGRHTYVKNVPPPFYSEFASARHQTVLGKTNLGTISLSDQQTKYKTVLTWAILCCFSYLFGGRKKERQKEKRERRQLKK